MGQVCMLHAEQIMVNRTGADRDGEARMGRGGGVGAVCNRVRQ